MPPLREQRPSSFHEALLQQGVEERIVRSAYIQSPNLELEQAMLSLGKKLPGAIQTFLADPFLQIKDPKTNPDLVEAMTAIPLATGLPAGAPQLTEGLRILQEALGPNGEEPLFNMPRRFTALLITDMLLHQTALPISRRMSVRFSKDRNRAMANIRKVHAAIPESQETLEIRGSLAQTMQAFQEELAKALAQEPQTRDEAYFQALLYSTINKVMRDSSLYREFNFYGNSEMRQWITTKEAQALAFLSNSPFSFDLLQEGVFEELDSHGLGLIFAGQWRLFNETAPDEEKLTALANYFLSHPGLQDEFWKSEAIDNDYSVIKWFFEQDTKILDRFIETMRLATVANKLIYIRGVLIAYTGYLKQDFPDHPNVPYLPERIRSLAEQYNLTPRIQQELAILEDREPGILYESAKKGLVARRARPEEIKNVIYVSRAPWPEREQEAQPAPAAREREIPTVTSGELATSDPWGKVQIVTQEAAQPVLEALAGKATRQIRPGQIDNIIAESRAHLTTPDRAPFTIMPALLPANNPLRKLDECGVIAIEFTNGSLTIVVDAAKAGIQTVGPEKIIVQAQVEEEPRDFGLPRLLYAASLLAKRSVSKIMLERQDEREIHGVVSSWNKKNNDMRKNDDTRDRALPLLGFGVQPGQKSLGRVLFFVGSKPTALDLVA